MKEHTPSSQAPHHAPARTTGLPTGDASGMAMRRATPGPRSLRLLVVEDNAINQLVLQRLLERHGHVVSTADNGFEALDLLAKFPYDCVLLDVEMPELDGPQTVARLRDVTRFGRAATTPVVALTAHTAKGTRERLLARGFDDYIPKPIDMAALEAALARITAAPHTTRQPTSAIGG